MTEKDVTTLTERGQTSVPAPLRKELDLKRGQRLLWEKVSDRELRVRLVEEERVQGAEAMRGFARRFRPEARRTEDWMRELREGED